MSLVILGDPVLDTKTEVLSGRLQGDWLIQEHDLKCDDMDLCQSHRVTNGEY